MEQGEETMEQGEETMEQGEEQVVEEEAAAAEEETDEEREEEAEEADVLRYEPQSGSSDRGKCLVPETQPERCGLAARTRQACRIGLPPRTSLRAKPCDLCPAHTFDSPVPRALAARAPPTRCRRRRRNPSSALRSRPHPCCLLARSCS